VLSLALGLVLGAAPGFLQPVPLRAEVSEDSDEQALLDLCHLPGAELQLRTRSNMLSSATLEALHRCRAPAVQLRLPLLDAHQDQLARIPRAQLLFELAPGEGLDWMQVSALGPRRLLVRVHGPLTAARAASLARLRNAEIELDLRGRAPNADELARFRDLARADRAVRIDAQAPPQLLAALAPLKLSGVVVEAPGNAIPPALLAALSAAPWPVRVALTWPFTAHQTAALARVHQLSLELHLGTLDDRPRHLKAALAPLQPDLSKPARGPAPGPVLDPALQRPPPHAPGSAHAPPPP